MHIIQLTADNVKRLKAVQINPDPHLQVIGGRNSQGKTSVLDAIWLALSGGAASREIARPVRDGSQSAQVELDLGELVVVRTWEHGRSSLKVYSPDGGMYASPQSMLDALVGKLTFDPLAFTRLPAREQQAELLKLADVDIDPAAIAAERERLYNARTDVGRVGKQMAGHAATLGDVEDVPDDGRSLSDALTAAREASELVARQGEDRRRLQAAEQARDDLQERLRQVQLQLAQAELIVNDIAGQVAAHQPEPDVAALYAAVGEVEERSAKIARNAERRRAQEQAAEQRRRYEQLTADIEALDRRKTEALTAAHFPVDGLGVDDAGVTYNGVPFAQASASEQIRVSLAMAMAANPRLKVIRIVDGSLLDDDNMALIREAAEANGFQVWIERVGDPGDGSAVVIEDGEVAAAK